MEEKAEGAVAAREEGVRMEEVVATERHLPTKRASSMASLLDNCCAMPNMLRRVCVRHAQGQACPVQTTCATHKPKLSRYIYV